MTNLTMLFNVLLTTLLSFFMTSGHASNNPFQVVYFFCFKIKFSAYPNFGNVLFSQFWIPGFVKPPVPFWTGGAASDRLFCLDAIKEMS